jgi:hypothetical protein
MNQACEPVRAQLSLYLYGELSFDEEEAVDAHLDGCEPCGKALAEERALHASLDSISVEPSPALLWSCRENLRERLAKEPVPAPVVQPGWWARVSGLMTLWPEARWMRPVGAMALLTAGFFGARATSPDSGMFQAMGFGTPSASRIRLVSPGTNGQIEIVLDETRQRTVTGGFDDAPIRALLLAAAKDPSDPGLRAETLDILNSQSEEADVRSVLLFALEHDQNAGVRLKAMEGLRPFVSDRAVQNVLARVLLTDGNPGMRTQAIDMLTAEGDPGREVVGAIQELMNRESNDYIRERGQRLLEAVKASAEIY